MTKAHREMENVGRTAGHGPYHCKECGANPIFESPFFSPPCSFVVAFSPPPRVHHARRRGPSMHPPRPFFSDALDTSEMRINSRSHPALAPSIAPTHTGETRQKKEFSHRQLELPKAREMTCRHCNEHDKFEKKQERRRSLDEAHNKHKNNAEIHNKGAQVHQSTFHSAPVA